MSEKKQEKGDAKKPEGTPELGVIGDIEQRLSLSFQAQPLVIPDDGRGPLLDLICGAKLSLLVKQFSFDARQSATWGNSSSTSPCSRDA